MGENGMKRNVFENNEPPAVSDEEAEDLKTKKVSVVLEPLDADHTYEFDNLASGAVAIHVVEKEPKDVSEVYAPKREMDTHEMLAEACKTTPSESEVEAALRMAKRLDRSSGYGR